MNYIPATGAKEKLPDIRDLKPKDLASGGVLPVIGKIDYSDQPVLNQGQKGICTAIALCQMIEKMYGIRLSYAFLYKVGKRVYDQNKKEGSWLRTMLKTANNYGLPRYELAPYDINQSHADFMNEPDYSPEVYKDALEHTLGGYASVPVMDKYTLAEYINKTPYGLYTRVVVGSNWYSDTQGNITWDKAKINPLRPLENAVSGHAILKLGYDYTNGMVTRDRNTWGENWCDKGEIDIPDFNDNITEAWILYKDPIVKPFNKNLWLGMWGEEVKNLQRALKIEGHFNYEITGYFGLITLSAVKAFQKTNLITPISGYVGPLTRGKLNGIFQ